MMDSATTAWNKLQSSSSAFLDRFFCISERKSSIDTEVVAGIVNFAANAYLLVVAPQILSHSGRSKEANLLGFILATAFSSVAVGVLSNLPIPAGVGLGGATYFAYTLTGSEYPYADDDDSSARQTYGSNMCLIASTIMLLLALSGLPWRLFRVTPSSVKDAMPIGLGLLLALNGFQQIQLVATSADTGVTMGRIASFAPITGLVTIAAMSWLHSRQWRVATILPMAAASVIGWTAAAMGVRGVDAPLPDWSAGGMGELLDHLGSSGVDLSRSWLAANAWNAPMPSLSLNLICLFDVMGITYAVSFVAGLVHRQGEADEELPGAPMVFVACALGSLVSALLGCSPVIVLGESFAGVLVGGRTGLTAVVMGLCFMVALPLAPIFTAVPLFASSPVLVLVGVDLLALAARLDFSGSRSLPTFCTIALMPFLYAIDKALLAGLGMHAVLRSLDWLAPPRRGELEA